MSCSTSGLRGYCRSEPVQRRAPGVMIRYLRVVPRDPKSPESVSEAMREFIDATEDRLAAAALYGQQR